MIKFWTTRGQWGWMSNFSNHPITVDDKRFATTEHYYQAMKATNDEDFEKVRTAKTPKEAKDIANKIALRPDWEEVKYDIIKEALRLKIQSYDFMRHMLIESGDKELVEDSPYDYIWGLGKDGTGQNLLGKAWMEIRTEVQSEEIINKD